ncbi:MAG: hypothetical protein EBZ36_11430, partial [Acidobacteria bacterium]|nr:hypothetical protein [Acidobacteriota bacterium]
LTLFKAPANSDQVKQLSADAWALKVLARTASCVVITLTHMTDDWEVKFSRAVENHADTIWGWRMSRQEKRDGIAIVRQTKARGTREFDFALYHDLSRHRWWCKGEAPVSDDFEPSQRIREDRVVRPLASDVEAARARYEARLPLYQTATLQIPVTAGMAPAEIVAQILAAEVSR